MCCQGTNKVEAIMLKLAAREEVKFSALAFRNMRRLRIFSVRNVYNSGHPVYFPAQLRWLEWPNYSPPSGPFNRGLYRRLVGLDLSKSSICILGKEFEVCTCNILFCEDEKLTEKILEKLLIRIIIYCAAI